MRHAGIDSVISGMCANSGLLIALCKRKSGTPNFANLAIRGQMAFNRSNIMLNYYPDNHPEESAEWFLNFFFCIKL